MAVVYWSGDPTRSLLQPGDRGVVSTGSEKIDRSASGHVDALGDGRVARTTADAAEDRNAKVPAMRPVGSSDQLGSLFASVAGDRNAGNEKNVENQRLGCHRGGQTRPDLDRPFADNRDHAGDGDTET